MGDVTHFLRKLARNVKNANGVSLFHLKTAVFCYDGQSQSFSCASAILPFRMGQSEALIWELRLTELVIASILAA